MHDRAQRAGHLIQAWRERRTLTLPPLAITDEKVARAYSHPLRTQILALLQDRVASPKEIAEELGTPLTNTSYHVRQLVSLGFLELVRRTPRRGAIEHYYTKRDRAEITNDVWGQLPLEVKRLCAGSWVDRTVREVAAAVDEGGFDRANVHMSRTAGPLDEKGWNAVVDELLRTLRRIEQEIEASRRRLTENPGAEATRSTIMLMHFATPEQEERTRDAADTDGRGEADLTLDEVAP